jgi:hypothetical protein
MVLTQRLAERTGGKTWLPGDDLVAPGRARTRPIVS